ncbi:MAG: FHIPEP family type III secretion protein [Hyphomonas sp.]
MSGLALFRSMKAGSGKLGLSRISDLLVVVGLTAIIGLMIFPLPTLFVDVLVAMNIMFAIILVLMAIYISHALEFSAFPAILLMSTLFRLGLSVATTRLILLNADAGSIIDTFGQTVAGGNIVVGLVVFLIITVVQFIVIAKGAERVAEVAARFSLDGMPGKQMSIDSDLRSGLITKDEARAKRTRLELDSKLHGNLDGAMKFVKGDAIASLVIIIINLVGGLAIGILMMDMPFGAAMDTYSILTIGDGLVAQVPALLSAIAAGLIVTRTAGEEDDRHLGETIAEELSGRPRVIFVASALCLAAALVPGFPTIVFTGLAITLFVVGVFVSAGVRGWVTEKSLPTYHRIKGSEAPAIAIAAEPLKLPAPELMDADAPLILIAGAEVPEQIDLAGLGEVLEQALADIRGQLGLPLPRSAIVIDETREGWSFSAFGMPLATGRLLGVEEPASALRSELTSAILRRADEFIGIQETSDLINRAGETYPDLVKESLRALSIGNISEILQRLVSEQVSIANVRLALEAIVAAAQHERELPAVIERVRTIMRRQICYKLAPDGKLRALVLDMALQERLRSLAQAGGDAGNMPVDPAVFQKITAAVSVSMRHNKVSVLIVPPEIRRPMRDLLVTECPDLHVLSANELAREIAPEIVEQISLQGAAQDGQLDGPEEGETRVEE